MIETENAVVIDVPIAMVWDYVSDISRWAPLFPGCKECVVIDDHNSRWVIKVGAGGLVRTVNVLVTVDRWDGPGRVDFSYKLEAEPVVGSGSYIAVSQGDNATEVTLKVQVVGSGSMAPMWEAMSKPLLPQLARSFAGKLKAEIEALAGGGRSQPVPATSPIKRLLAWIKSRWQQWVQR
jgi:carbon monoxide dehydrogenase subunit G